MVGVIYAKLARPKKRAQTLVFSKNAVICMRNGKYCLLFRIGDVRRSHLVEAHVRVMVIRKKVMLLLKTILISFPVTFVSCSYMFHVCIYVSGEYIFNLS